MNNDRFKFRVWDNEISAYRQSGTVQLCSTGEPFIINGDMHPEAINNVDVEQCTGLRDRNGKLIYEGDILGDEQPLRITVVWKNIYWGYYADGSFHALPFWVNQLEIIGNIHGGEA